MKIIIDECVPSIVKKGLPSRGIVTVQEMGWAGIKNGKLLELVAADFDVFITSDKNLRHQQNLTAFDLAIILLPTNQVPAVQDLLPQMDEALNHIRPKDFKTMQRPLPRVAIVRTGSRSDRVPRFKASSRDRRGFFMVDP